jgi:hypothetical protein
VASAGTAAFLVVGVLLAFAAILAFVTLGSVRLESRLGVLRDGLPPGRKGPSWEAKATSGRVHHTPRRTGWQLLVFCNHGIREFPDLPDALRELELEAPDLEILILSHTDAELTDAIAAAMGITVPVVAVDQALYDRYNVRALPFVFVLDEAGIVRSMGLGSTRNAFLHRWQMALASRGAGQGQRTQGIGPAESRA